MNSAQLLAHFERISDAPDAIPRLRRFILDLAVRGKLVEQDQRDESASELLKRIEEKKARLVKIGEIKKLETFEPVEAHEVPFTIPSGWEVIRMGWLARKLGAGSTPLGGKSVYQSEGVPFLRSQNVHDNGLRLDDVARISCSIHERMSGTHVHHHDILLNITGASIGRCALVPSNFVEGNVSQHVAIIRLFLSDIRQFIHLSLTSPFFQKVIDDVQVGVSREGLSMQRLRLFPMLLPPLAEQHRIVAKVDELMALCDRLAAAQAERESVGDRLAAASLHRLNNGADAEAFRNHARFYFNQLPRLTTRSVHIQQLRQTILNLAVRGKLVPQDPNDEPAEKLLIKAEQKKGKWVGPIEEQEVPFQLPPSWIWFRLGDISSLKHGYAFSSEYFTSEPAPFVLTTPGNFYEKGGFRDRESKRKYYFGPVDPEFIFKPGDLIIPMTEQAAGLLGSPAFIPEDGRVYVHNQRLGKLSFSESIAPEFAFWFFNSKFFRGELARTCTGMKVRHTSPDRVLKVPFPLPPLAEQHRIIANVEELMALCDRLEAQLITIQTKSRSLLEAVLYEALSA